MRIYTNIYFGHQKIVNRRMVWIKHTICKCQNVEICFALVCE